MKHIGKTLKEHIEKHHLVKGKVALRAGITYNYLSTIFHQESVQAKLLEKLCIGAGIHPSAFFDTPDDISKNYSDISSAIVMDNASLQIGENEALRDLLSEKERIIAEKERIIEEKERLIQILLKNSDNPVPGQKRDKPNTVKY